VSETMRATLALMEGGSALKVADRVGARPDPRFRTQFTDAWLSQKRTEALLGNL
jgi:hypothetical protein